MIQTGRNETVRIERVRQRTNTFSNFLDGMTLTAIAAMLIVIFMVYLTSVKINTNVSVRDITVSGVLMYACTVSIYMLLRSFANRKGRASKAFAAVWETIEKNAVYIVENGLAGRVREYCRQWEEAEHNEARRRALADCCISLEKYLADYAKYSRREIKKNFPDLTEYQRATILRVKKIKRLHFDESYLSVFENYGHRVAPSGGFTVRKRRKLQTIQTFFTTAISSLFSAYLALEIIADPSFATVVMCLVKVVIIVGFGAWALVQGYHMTAVLEVEELKRKTEEQARFIKWTGSALPKENASETGACQESVKSAAANFPQDIE